MTAWRTIPFAAMLMAAQVADAGTVGITPLIASGTDTKVVGNIRSLMASELDFMVDFDGVVEFEKIPSGLNKGCLNSAGCLGGIARSKGASALVSGTLQSYGGNFKLDLVYWKGGKIVRRKSFEISQDAEAVANGMTAIMKEVVTGVGPKAAADAEPSVADFEDEGDDFAFDDGAEEARLARLAASKAAADAAAATAARQAAEAEAQRQVAEARMRAEEEARRRVEEERRRQDELARQRAAEEARTRAEEDARQREEQERREREERERREAAAAAPAVDAMDDFDPSLISFGAAEITSEEVEAAISFAPAAPDSTPDPAVSRRSYRDDDLADEEMDLGDLDGGGIVDLDGGGSRASKPKRDRATGSTGHVSRGPAEGAYKFTLAVRGGFTKYYSFNFLQVGAELGVPVLHSGVWVIGGIGTFATQRAIPQEFQDVGLDPTMWNTIFPINVGLLYKFVNSSLAAPYIGGDLITAQYFKDLVGADWALGGRGRLGVDLVLSDSVGLNFDVAIGYWKGTNFPLIQQDIQAGGLLPGGSAALLFRF